MFDSVFHGAEVDIRHCDAIAEIHLDECPLDITLKNSPTSEGVSAWLLLFQGLGLVLVPGSGITAALSLSTAVSICV